MHDTHARGRGGPGGHHRSEHLCLRSRRLSRVARTYVGGVGYSHLRDFSVGPIATERLEERASREAWPDHVAVGDLSYDPVKIVHWLSGEDPPYERLIVVSAVRRGRRPGEVAAYRWDQSLPDPERIQACVSEAVTGVIDLDNLLVVLRQFEAAPRDIFVVEVEPETEAMGDELTAAVAEGTERAVGLASAIAVGPTPELPTSPLGGFGSQNGKTREAPSRLPGTPE